VKEKRIEMYILKTSDYKVSNTYW